MLGFLALLLTVGVTIVGLCLIWLMVALGLVISM